MDVRFLEAAVDLGATPLQTFWRIIVPLSKLRITPAHAGVHSGGRRICDSGAAGALETLMIGHGWDEFFTTTTGRYLGDGGDPAILVPMAIFNKYKAEQEARA